jgi:hypothetical protein
MKYMKGLVGLGAFLLAFYSLLAVYNTLVAVAARIAR